MNTRMIQRLRFPLLLLVALIAVLAPASAQAADFDPNGFHLQSSSLSVHENSGAAQITIERNDVSRDAQIRYISLGVGVPCGDTGCTAVSPYDFTSVKGMLDFPPGVRE